MSPASTPRDPARRDDRTPASTPSAPSASSTATDRVRGLQWPAVLWLTVVWVLLWGEVTFANVLAGLVIGLLVTLALPLPRLAFRVRMRPRHTVVLASRFLWDLVVASTEVAWYAVRPGPVTRGVVMDLKLRSGHELFQTITAEMVALVPGTVVIDLDSGGRLLTLHAIGVSTRAEAERVRRRVLAQEARVLRAFHPDPGSVLDARRRRAGELEVMTGPGQTERLRVGQEPPRHDSATDAPPGGGT